jgi:hypothetical protein
MKSKYLCGLLLTMFVFLSTHLFCVRHKSAKFKRKKKVTYPTTKNFACVGDDIMHCIEEKGVNPEDAWCVCGLDEALLGSFAEEDELKQYVHSGKLWHRCVEKTDNECLRRKLEEMFQQFFLPKNVGPATCYMSQRIARYHASCCINDLQTRRALKVRDIENGRIARYIRKLQRSGVKVMALTSREIGRQKETECQLKEVGINLEITAPLKNEELFFGKEEDEFRRGLHPYRKGLLIVTPRAGNMNKGRLLNMFLGRLKLKGALPKHVWVVDDGYTNLEVIVNSLAEEYPEIKVHPWHYTRAADFPFDEELVDNFLKKFLGKNWYYVDPKDSPCTFRPQDILAQVSAQ